MRIGNLMVNPIEYNPTTNEIKVKTNIEFNVVFDGADYTTGQANKERLQSPYFETIYQSLINYMPLETRDL